MSWAFPGRPTPTPGKGTGTPNITLPPSKGLGTWACGQRSSHPSSSPGWALETPFKVYVGPWQRATLFSDPSLRSAQGHLRAGGCSEADAGGGGGVSCTSGHRAKARDKVTSLQGWDRKLKQGTIKSYINLKFKMTDQDLQWAMRGHSLHLGLPCWVTLGQEIPSLVWAMGSLSFPAGG